ncbi:hypothetical protein P4J13_27135 [Bacillus anthracis]|nr:hypothetical protein [Bacillus anthracis]MEB9507577.1 hypothetical protein [Bacillus anthracis]
MINLHLKKSGDNLEIKFSCDFEKIISLMFGASTLLDAILKSL